MEALGIVKGFDIMEEHGTDLGAIFRDSILETSSGAPPSPSLDQISQPQTTLMNWRWASF
jgi:hypothetical protein